MFYLGIDVSKAKLDCCLLKKETPEKRKSKVLANSVTGVAELLHWLAKQGAQPEQTHALLEGTGVYHETRLRRFMTAVSPSPSSTRRGSEILARVWAYAPRPMLWTVGC